MRQSRNTNCHTREAMHPTQWKHDTYIYSMVLNMILDSTCSTSWAKYKLVNYLWDKPQCHSPLALATLLVFQGNYLHILQPRVRLFGTNTMSNYCILTSHNSTSNIVNEPYGDHRNKHNYVRNVFNVFYCVC